MPFLLKTRKSILIAGLVPLGLALLYIILGLLARPAAPAADELAVTAYFLNPSASRLEPETRYIRRDTNANMVGELVGIYFAGPLSKSLQKTAPDGLRIVGDGRIYPWDEGSDSSYTFEVEFSPEYENMNDMEELFFRSSFVWTMTSLPFLKDVHIYVNGREILNTDGTPVGVMSRQTVDISPMISPEKTELKQLTLYFPDAGDAGLVKERRTVSVNPELPVERYVIEQIIAGPSGGPPAVPAGTKLRDVNTVEGICYVNLSGEFLKTADNLTVYALVDALTDPANCDVQRVQFLIESEKTDKLVGGLDLSKPFERNASLAAAAGP